MRIEGMRLVCGLIVVIVLLNLKKGESRRSKSGSRSNSFVNCRAHSASLADYGGVGDGKTSNTKAFENAIRNLSQYEELVMEKHQTQRHLKMQ
ncbi:probable polygalacturonase [Arachis ipaensis]|uniref:probable polygalacturonase n=1 Tax=Arachis ipaensis TaxID=130454 RepID=UPI0007AF174D|nr:probable polygalacturonase [Arachis ipaensis]